MKSSVSKILFISLSNIGDAVMTTPILETLHKLYPGAVIDIVGDSRSSEIFKYCPYRGKIFHKEKKKLLRGLPALLKDLWFQSYDLIVDVRTDGLAYLIPAGKRLTKLNRITTGPHAVQQHMGIISKIYQGIPPECNVWVSKAEKTFAEKSLGKYHGKKILGLGTGANSKKKIWPKEKYLSLIKSVGNNFEAVVFLGDGRDAEPSAYIASKAEVPCINLCGKTNILEAVAVQQYLGLFVGNDSGLGHLASATGTPTITIFGVGEPNRYRPWGKKSLWLIGEKQSIKDVSVEAVVGVLNKQDQEK